MDLIHQLNLREVSIMGIYFSSLAVYFVIAILGTVLFRQLLFRTRLIRWFWHPDLLQIAVFTLLFSGVTWFFNFM